MVDGESSYNITMSNTGHDATAFSAQLKLLGGPWREIMAHALFGKGASYSTSFTHPSPLPEGDSVLLLRYTDGLGRILERAYKVSKESEHAHADLTFHAVEA